MTQAGSNPLEEPIARVGPGSWFPGERLFFVWRCRTAPRSHRIPRARENKVRLLRKMCPMERSHIRGRSVVIAAFSVLFALSLSSRPIQGQYSQANGLSAGRLLSGAVLGTGVGLVAGLSADVFRANVLEDYFEGEPSLANIGAHLSPWLIVGGAVGLVGIGLREDATAGHVWVSTLEGAGIAAVGGGAAGLLSGALDNDGLARIWEGVTAGTLMGLGAGALSGFIMATWSPGTDYGAPASGYVGAAVALPLLSWTWRF